MNQTTPAYVQTNCRELLAQKLNDELATVLKPVTIFVGVEAILGFFGNIFVLYVYLFHYHVCSFKYFVLCLAVIDLVSCLTTVPGEMVTQLYWYVYPVPIICKIKSLFNIFTVSASACILFIMALDRYLKVCRPHGRQIRSEMARRVCIVVSAVTFLVSMPTAFLWGTRSYVRQYSGCNTTVTVCEKDERYDETQAPLAYISVIQSLICLLMVVMTLLYVIIGRKLLSNQVATAGSTEAQTRQISTIRNRTNRLTRKTPQSEASASTNDATEHWEDVTTSSQADSSTETPKRPAPLRNQRTMNRTGTLGEGVRTHQSQTGSRVRRKTLIMFLLTAVFIVTIILYLSLLSGIARSDDILDSMSASQKAIYFFFFRLYFVNHVINPILYGILDPECRAVIRGLCKT